MNKDVLRKGIVLGVIFLFVGAGVVPSISGKTSNFGKIIYVDDDSECPGDGTMERPYCKIQYAIDNVSNGDEIHVWAGVYYENIFIDKSNLKIIGNDSDSTIIDGSSKCEVIKIISDGVSLENLSIQDSGILDSGVFIRASYITINNCDIVHNFHGIILNTLKSNNISIVNSTISHNTYSGVRFIDLCKHNRIYNCDIKDNRVGIFLMDCNLNTISNNHIENNKNIGIAVQGGDSHHNRISNNNIMENGLNPTSGLGYGILCWGSGKNNILSNNLIGNHIQAHFFFTFIQNWNGNYWQPRHWLKRSEIFNIPIPYPIFGTAGFQPFWFPWINVDPAPSMNPIPIP